MFIQRIICTTIAYSFESVSNQFVCERYYLCRKTLLLALLKKENERNFAPVHEMQIIKNSV